MISLTMQALVNAYKTNDMKHRECTALMAITHALGLHRNEFCFLQSTVHRKRESMELFQTSKKLHADDQDSSVAKILRERSTIAASMRSINDVIR